jgi:hypothetical protein
MCTTLVVAKPKGGFDPNKSGLVGKAPRVDDAFCVEQERIGRPEVKVRMVTSKLGPREARQSHQVTSSGSGCRPRLSSLWFS